MTTDDTHGDKTRIEISLPEELLAAIDGIVARGDAEDRADVIRTALEQHVAALERDRIDAEIVDGYRRIPSDTPDEWGDLDSWTEAAAAETMQRLDAEEREAGFESW